MNRVRYPYVSQRVAQIRDIAVCAVKFNFSRKKSATKFFCVKTSSGKVVATILPLEFFTQRNFVADFFREKLNFSGTNNDIAFLCHPLGDIGITYTVHLCSLESAWSTSYRPKC